MIKKKINHALIMAAGRGIRMVPLTNQIPKAMAPLNGTTLIANGIRELKKYIKNIHITVGYKREILSSHVMFNNVNTIINSTNRGNCWWIFNSVISTINEPIFVLTCDNVVNLNFDQLSLDFFDLKQPDCMIVPTKPVDDLEGDFIIKSVDNLIKSINRKNVSELMCSGVQILNPRNINKKYKKCDNFYDLWSQIIKSKSIYCSNINPSFWYAVDNIDQLKSLNKSYKFENEK